MSGEKSFTDRRSQTYWKVLPSAKNLEKTNTKVYLLIDFAKKDKGSRNVF